MKDALRALVIQTDSEEPMDPFVDWTAGHPSLASDYVLPRADAETVWALFDTASATPKHAVQAIRDRLVGVVKRAESRPDFANSLAGRLQRGWVEKTRFVAIGRPSGRVVFPAGSISDDLMSCTMSMG